MWLYLGIISAVFLGLYDISKKHALQANTVLLVLFLATVAGAITISPLAVLSRIVPEAMKHAGLYVPTADLTAHLHFFVKALIVSSSWVLAYFAIKHLPISIVSLIRASEPVSVLFGAIVLFHERLTITQWGAIAIIIISYYGFSIAGSSEGISFHRNKWVLFMFLSGLIGAGSALYDKFLIQTLGFNPILVQVWFSIYLVVILGIVLLVFWLPNRNEHTKFIWRWSIVLIGVMLIIADFAYFHALQYPGSMIGLLSAIRRCSVIFSFAVGAMIFGDVNIPRKAIALAGVLLGVFLIVLSK